MKGIINLNKPKGWTSRDAVNKVRNILHVRDCGHMGTLDPQGEGVLLIGVGKATRLFNALLEKDKLYQATFKFGYETDTLDGDGKIMKTSTRIPSLQEIKEILPHHCGEILQIPPAYSAKSINGVRAYNLARNGKEVKLNPSLVKIYSIEVADNNIQDEYTFCVHCSAGTYIRSICRDIAYELDTFATMTSITRLRAGEFSIENAHTIDDIERLKSDALIPLEIALSEFPRYDVPSDKYRELLNGIKLEAPRINALFTVYCNGELFGLGENIDGILKIKTYLKD